MDVLSSEVRSILVIDDDREDYELISEAIYEVDPEISVYFLDRCEEAEKYKGYSFDLVLLDINMPYHDGFYWLKTIREKGYSSLPIVMYTNSLYPGHIAKAYQEGASLYFPKPDSFQHLLDALKKLVCLNWSNPGSITQRYLRNGQYLTFQG